MDERNALLKTLREFRDRYFQFFPKKATQLGNHDFDGILGKWNREGVRERITFLEHYRDLVKESLEVDALVARNIIDSHLFHLKVIKPQLRPDFFVNYALESIDYMIHLLEIAPDDDCRKQIVNALVSRVNGFPILFEQSREWLTFATPISRNLALGMVRFFQQFLETDYRQFVYALDFPMEFQEKLVGVIPFTIESLSKFAHFVRTLEVIEPDHPKLRRSRKFFKDLFREKYLLTYGDAALLDICAERIRTLSGELSRISGGDNAGYFKGLVERNRIAYSENGFNDRLMGYIRQQAETYFGFCRDTGLIPAKRLPLIQWTPIYKRSSSPLASYISCGPYETYKQEGMLWVCPVKEPLSRDGWQARGSILNRQMINSLVIHELVGHHLQADAMAGLDKEAFKLSDNLSTDEGFALYVEEMFAEQFAATLDDSREAEDMLFFQKKAELMRAHRVYVDVGMATRRISIGEASRYFAEKNDMDLETARKECEKYFLNPGMASSYLIGKIELMKIRDHIRTKCKDRFSLPLFHKGLVSYGSIPIPLIMRSMVEKLFMMDNTIQ